VKEANRWRDDLGRKVAKAYAQEPKCAAVALGGSVARRWADRHSDVELFVFWAEPPSDDERLSAVTRSGGSIDIFWAKPPSGAEYRQIFERTGGEISQLWPYEDDEWSEHYYVHGVNIGISGFLTSTMDRYLADVLVGHDTDDRKQINIAAVQNGIPLYGVSILRAWQANADAFPDQLIRAIVAQQLEFRAPWDECEMLAERGEWLLLNELLCQMERQLLRVLLGLNRMYLPEPRLKWTGHLIELMRLKPADLSARLTRIFRMPPSEAVQALGQIWEEALVIVEAQQPDVDVSFARKRLRHRRTRWDHSPPGAS
jgi:hypothetical protein